jgi:hypothetical protein
MFSGKRLVVLELHQYSSWGRKIEVVGSWKSQLKSFM